MYAIRSYYDVFQDLEVPKVAFAEGHPEAGALDLGEVLDQGLEFLVVHEEALLGADVRREVEVHGPGERVGLDPFTVLVVAAAGGDFADVDFGVEVGGEGLAVIPGVAVDDVQHVDARESYNFV